MTVKNKTQKTLWPYIELITGWNPIKSNRSITVTPIAPIRIISINIDLKGE